MTNDEQKFEQLVNAIRFDDEPSADHREKLERQLLQSYDNHRETDGYVEPVALYFRKLGIAASFLIGAGVLFWVIDAAFIRQDPFAHHPQKETIHQIIEEEDVTGAEKKQLIAQIRQVWNLISSRDEDGLVAVLNTADIAYTVRSWAATCLAKFAGSDTLQALESQIYQLNVTDPDDPLVIAADKLRARLNVPDSQDSAPENQQPGIQSLDDGEPNL